MGNGSQNTSDITHNCRNRKNTSPRFCTPLYSDSDFHEACGTGFIAEISGKPSRRVVRLAMDALKRLEHRGARMPGAKTGDGSGILTDIPKDYFQQIIFDMFRYVLADDEILSLAMVFISDDSEDKVDSLFRQESEKMGMSYIGNRKVPIELDFLNRDEQENVPNIQQYFIIQKIDAFRSAESKLYLLRKRLEKQFRIQAIDSFISSLSTKTVVYKGLILSDYLDRFYKDLKHPDYIAKVAVFHERFSTNTTSSWAMAQPFRMIAHNGEINTIKGNRLWMKSRETDLESDYWGDDLEDLIPLVSQSGSDSFSLDNALEFLSQSGRSVYHSMMMLIPEPYQKSINMSRKLKDFYLYHENFIEPWDGPAALVFTDGEHVGAKLDRNGLRPLRYSVTKDGLVIMASEAGVIEISEDNLVKHHHMSAGEIFGIALDGSGIPDENDIKNQVVHSAAYSNLLAGNLRTIKRGSHLEEFGQFNAPENGFNTKLRLVLGWGDEDLHKFIIPMAEKGMEPIGSMGDDTPIAILSEKNRRMYDYFKHSFAQVTNPPIDSIREKYVTALFKYLGSEENLLSSEPRFNGAIRIESPVLSPREVKLLMGYNDWFPHSKVYCHVKIDEDMNTRIQDILEECKDLVYSGHKIIFLSDEDLVKDSLPIPMALMVSAVHNYLTEKKIRNSVSIICLTGDIVSDHHLAVLIGMGASAVYPYMAYELIREHFDLENWPEMMFNYRQALEKGLLKIMAKMGISTLVSYHGSMLFYGIGLSAEIVEKYFPAISCHTGGLNMKLLYQKLKDRNEYAYSKSRPVLEKKGLYMYRKSGEIHGFSPFQVKRISSMSQGKEFPNEADLIYLRDLLEYKALVKKNSTSKMESEASILKRFGAGGMSFGAISDASHRVIARGFYAIGGRSNTGEGGESSDRFTPGNPDMSENSYVKQVASGRFGVTVDYLASAREIQIKMAQGAKPGEGGQLPGHKVSVNIAAARSSTPGVHLISPAPHHDIYSIEDIAQLIYDLKQVNPRSKISVKLVSQPGVGTVASGVVKAGADIILISGAEGGTAASPLGSIKNAGFPWEFGLAETHQALTYNGLRSQVKVRVDGGIKTAKDIIIATLLGAEEYDFGTSILLAIGCTACRQCHLNTCHTGISTQDETLIKRFKGKPEHIVNYLQALAKEIWMELKRLKADSLDELVGRTDRLIIDKKFRALVKERGLDLSAIINPAEKAGLALQRQAEAKPAHKTNGKTLDEEVIELTRSAIMTHSQAVINRYVKNTDRSIGTRLSGELAFLYGRGKFNGKIQYRLQGAAGQSFGAFLIDGVELRLRGVANDYVGKGMSGGLITIRMPREIRHKNKIQTVMGNVALYGATGGTLLVAGRACERFAVRNSGASAVVEEIGNHGCEYMTRGTVVVLGSVGQNFGAGMTGGVAFLYHPDNKKKQYLNTDFVESVKLSEVDEDLLFHLIHIHHFRTGSMISQHILNNWDKEKILFDKIIPKAIKHINYQKMYDEYMTRRISNI